MRWLAAVLTWFAADCDCIHKEKPRAAACCQMAHATMCKRVKNAEQDKDAEAALGEPGGGREAEEGREQEADGSGERLLLEGSSSVEAGCANGKCVAVPRVRQGLRR